MPSKIADEMYRKRKALAGQLNTIHQLLCKAFARGGQAADPSVRVPLHAKHGSWLDMAEIELGILGRQCLSRRIENVHDLRREVKAWETTRDAAEAKVNWQFTTADARIKLRRLYPSVEE
jgi:hypothetical protein